MERKDALGDGKNLRCSKNKVVKNIRNYEPEKCGSGREEGWKL